MYSRIQGPGKSGKNALAQFPAQVMGPDTVRNRISAAGLTGDVDSLLSSKMVAQEKAFGCIAREPNCNYRELNTTISKMPALPWV